NFSSLSAKYPLKLISPTRATSLPRDLGSVFVMTYGGGVVGNDSVKLEVKVEGRSRLALLTQGSTKVFKSKSVGESSRQALDCTVEKNGTLFVLPAPTTLFSNASFVQSQLVELQDSTCSVCLLDWYTSGRSLSNATELWSFDLFNSFTSIRYRNMSLPTIHDNLVLSSSAEFVSLPSRLGPYTCYASFYLIGPAFVSLAERIHDSFTQSANIVYRMKEPLDLVWSVTLIKKGEEVIGATVRAASKGTERMRNWLRGEAEDGL
ncbi:urease accessory protein UreD, partial [Atractiella rhizophila]